MTRSRQSLTPSLVIEQVDNLQLPLVNRFYKQCRYSAKAGRGETVLIARLEGVIRAAVRLVPATEDWLFLRSMCVDPEYRGQGVGGQFLLGIEPWLADEQCYCFPFSHLTDFYQRGGFVLYESENVAGFIREAHDRYTRQGRDIQIMIREGESNV